MSADNCVMVLECVGMGEIKLYRVAEVQNLESLHFVPDGHVCADGEEFWNLDYLWRNFRDCKVWLNREDALRVAEQCLSELDVCEYGLQICTLPRTFPTKKEVSMFLLKTFAYSTRALFKEEDEQPPPPYFLDCVFENLIDLLHTMIDDDRR